MIDLTNHRSRRATVRFLSVTALVALFLMAGAGISAPASAGPLAQATAAGTEQPMSPGELAVRSMVPGKLPADWKLPKSIGHVTNYLVHEWYQNETKGEAVRAKEHGIDFSINDANLDLQKSLAAVDDYVAKGTSVIVFTPVNEKASGPTIKKVADSKIPVVCEGSPTDGCTTLVSIDDYAAGFKVGVWAGNYAKDNFGGKAQILDVGLPALSTTVARSKGFVDGIHSVLADATVAQSVDGKGLKDEAVKVAADALTAHPDVNIIFGINDDSALGGLQAYKAAGMDTSKLLVVGFGCEGKACKNALMEGGPYKVSAAMFPEYQGRLLIDASVAAFNNVELPPHIVAPTLPMTKDILADYYTKDGDNFTPNFDAIAKISTAGEK
jgi:ribose transport system substrate-binding protein